MASLLAGKTVLITGASSGIGAAIAHRFVEHGAKAVLADVQDEKGSLLAKELGGKYVHCDVSKEADVEQAVKTAVEAFGSLDCVVNNAGIVAASGGVFEMDMASFQRTLDVNLCGVMHGIKHGAHAMKAAGTSGTIINLASIAGLTGEYHIADYAASKAGVIALTKVAASEVAPFGIRVNAIAPGYTATPMVALAQFGSADAPPEDVEAFVASISPVKGHSILPGDIANAALYLASPLGRSVNGHVLVVDLGATTGCVGQGGSHQPQAMVNEQ